MLSDSDGRKGQQRAWENPRMCRRWEPGHDMLGLVCAEVQGRASASAWKLGACSGGPVPGTLAASSPLPLLVLTRPGPLSELSRLYASVSLFEKGCVDAQI